MRWKRAGVGIYEAVGESGQRYTVTKYADGLWDVTVRDSSDIIQMIGWDKYSTLRTAKLRAEAIEKDA